MYFWNGAHPQVAAQMPLAELMQKATEVILDLEVNEEVLARLGTSFEDLERIGGLAPRSWVEVVVRLVVRDEAIAEDRLEEALDFHRKVSDRASSHLALIAENLARTHWQAASLLSKDPEKAQAAARSLVNHIARTSPSSRSPFERFLFEDDDKWDCLVAFANARPAVRLWHGRGRFEGLFRWLATLFLVGPDHVLDCERVHARWKWIIATKRGVRLPSLNAILKVTHYLDGHNGVLPAHEDLEAHLQAARQQLEWDLQEVEDDDNVARGWRHQMVFRERFNLGGENWSLERNVEPRRNPPAGDAYKTTWRTYCRSVLQRGHFFQFSSNLEVFFYINENKVLGGRQERGEGEAVGRNMVLTFFEAFAGHPGMVRRVDRRDGAMHPRQMTVAELLQVCGMNLPHDPERSSAETEELLEEEFGRQELRRFSGHLETGSSELHVYMLAEETDAEEAFVKDMGLQNLTKIALARFLEKVGRGPRRAHWARTLEDLQGEAGPLMAAEGIAQGEARAKAKGKAAVKAKAKGKAKGKGRGGRGGPP